jgi:prepilin-type N-terminal cleavage/methylation domain-containing protein
LFTPIYGPLRPIGPEEQRMAISRNQGFTLIELLILVVLLGMLAAVLLPKVLHGST